MSVRLLIGAVLILSFATGTTYAAGPADGALIDAARAANWTSVRTLVSKGLQRDGVNAADSDGTTALHFAVRADEVDIVSVLIRAGADTNAENRLGVTPLFLAAQNGNAVMVQKLLAAGANADQVDRATGESILMVAIRAGSTDSVRALLSSKANPNVAEPQLRLTPLMLAAEAGNADIVRALLERGADIHARTRTGATPAPKLPCIDKAGCGSHGVGIIRGGLPEQGYRAPIPGAMTALMYAAREGHIDAARLLLDAGSPVNDVDKNDITPLFMAIGNNHIDMARFLIDRGANINAVDWYGRTPLFAAVEIRNVDLHYVTFQHMVNEDDRKVILDFMSFLLDHGVDVNIRVKEVPPLRRWMYLLGGSLAWVDFTGQTPFLLASLSGDVETMRLLLKHGADPKIQTNSGTNALMAAAGVNWVYNQTYTEGEKSLLEAVKMCLELGMDVNATNSMGLTAAMGAANRGSDSIIEFLVSKGARLDMKDSVGRTAYNWAEGVFLATHAAVPKPGTMALIDKLLTQGKQTVSR
jgi:ankyrin repeat protein